jgi:hypothetical protein
MKQTTNRWRTGVIVLFAVIAGASISVAQQPKGSPREEFPFDQVGTVTKHEVDTCQVGINYKLHSAVKAPLHPTTHWLAATSESDKATLEKASKDGGLVQVKGTAMVSVENCKWIAVSSVKPVKKSDQNKTAKKD